jgi:DNA-binding transcriptional LysR family regulator
MAAFGGQLSSELLVGLMPTVTRCALSPALNTFVKTNPNTRIRIIEGYSQVLTERVRNGEFAFAVVPAFQGAVGLNTRAFLSTPEVLVSSRNSKLRHLDPVRLNELDPLKLVLPGHENTRRRSLESHLTSNGVRIGTILELDAMMGTLDLVASTDWVTILPGVMMATDLDHDRFSVNPIIDPVINLELVLIEPARQPMDLAAQDFLKMLRDSAQKVNSCWAELIPSNQYSRRSRVPAEASA